MIQIQQANEIQSLLAEFSRIGPVCSHITKKLKGIIHWIMNNISFGLLCFSKAFEKIQSHPSNRVKKEPNVSDRSNDDGI
ncbi:hypothetical protein ACFLZ8_04200 [Planctomycetota bacterium]